MNRAASTVLVINDDPDTGEAIQCYLELDGFAVELASNGREGLEKLQAGLRPCVIVLDLLMPEMNGYEFRDAQMKDRDLAAIPVILWSASVEVQEAAAHLQTAAYVASHDYLDRLAELVRKFRSS